MNSFIAWIGGKKLLRKEIVKRFPEEGFTRYVEVFGGAGWVLFEKEQAYSLLFLFDRECRECAANTRQIRRKHRKRQREEGRGVRKGVPTDRSRG